MQLRKACRVLAAASLATVAYSAIAATSYPFPYILEFSPTSGAPGTVVTVTGTGFTGLNGAWIGEGHNAGVTVVSDTEVKVKVPADATTGQLALLNPSDAAWSPNNFKVTPVTATAPPPSPTPAPAPTPTPAPTPALAPVAGAGVWTPPSGADLVYYQGVFRWAGDWSDVEPNYSSNASTGSAGVDGVHDSIKLPGDIAYEYWLPYPPLTAGAPASNKIGSNLTGKTMMTIAIKPTQVGLRPVIGFYRADAATVDIAFGNSVSIANAAYGPATPEVGKWNVYKIPLSAFGIGTPGWIYKFIVQEQGATPQQVEIDQVGFY